MGKREFDIFYSWNSTTADIGMSKCFGQSIIVKDADRLKHGCGSKACAQ